MPSCWYVLQRFFLRVDKQLVRVLDTRILCRFGNPGPLLVREVLHAEGSFKDLSKAGAPATAVSLPKQFPNAGILFFPTVGGNAAVQTICK